MLRRSALLIEGFSFGAIHEAFENNGAIPDSVERTGGDGKVIARQVQLGDSRLDGEVQLIGMGDLNLTPLHHKRLFSRFLAHEERLTCTRSRHGKQQVACY